MSHSRWTISESLELGQILLIRGRLNMNHCPVNESPGQFRTRALAAYSLGFPTVNSVALQFERLSEYSESVNIGLPLGIHLSLRVRERNCQDIYHLPSGMGST